MNPFKTNTIIRSTYKGVWHTWKVRDALFYVTQAFVWGLNDRGQLGSEVEEARVKTPVESRALAKLRPIQFVGGAKTLFIISQDGKVNYTVDLLKGLYRLG